jgi:hypothetical protein
MADNAISDSLEDGQDRGAFSDFDRQRVSCRIYDAYQSFHDHKFFEEREESLTWLWKFQ